MSRNTPMWYQMFEVVASLIFWLISTFGAIILFCYLFGRDYFGWFE